jgi:hypothetical protein
MRNLLVAIYVHRVQNGDERWRAFAQAVMQLVETAVVSRQHEVIAKFALVADMVASGGRFAMRHAVTFMQMLFNFSMISWCLQPPGIREELIRVINPDYEAAEEEVREVVKCITSELLEPTVAVLKPVVDPEFFMEMTSE